MTDRTEPRRDAGKAIPACIPVAFLTHQVFTARTVENRRLALSTIFQLDNEQRDPPRSTILETAREAGFDAILWRGEWLLFGPEALQPEVLVREAQARGLRPMFEIDLARFPVEHPLVQKHSQLFSIRRKIHSDRPVDPRQPIAPFGEAIARLNHPDACQLLVPAIAERLIELAAEGAGGFRFINPQRQGESVLGAIQEKLANYDVVTLAGPSTRTGEANSPGDALDHVIVGFGLADLQAGRVPAVCGEPDVPVIGELASDLSNLDADGHGATALLLGAAAVFSGVIIPEELFARCPEPVMAARKAAALSEQAASYDGAVQILSREGPVLTLARMRKGDVRARRGAMLVIVNSGSSEHASPEAGALIQRTGTALDLTQADLSPVRPAEVRIIAASPAEPIIPELAPGDVAMATARPRLVAEIASPRVEGGDFPVKRVVGDAVHVDATIFADGHEQLAAELRWRPADSPNWNSSRLKPTGKNDLWTGGFLLERLGPHEFVVEAWWDRFGGFRRDFIKKLDAGVAQPVDYTEGRAFFEEAAARLKGKTTDADKLTAVLERLDAAASPDESAAILLDEDLAALMDAVDDRPFRIISQPQRVDAERLAARFSSWYELFPRSMTDDKSRHGTLKDVIPHLPRIRDMGFDTLYFPPIHPIGKTNRKGPNNTLTPEPHDVGSPYAIGSPDGGHDAIHPELGSFEDFDHLVEAAREHGLEIALDFAIQASPDHPWLTEHPGWFSWRADGSMKYAENPPKKYQDIVNLDFYGADAVPDLWLALRDVVLLWIEHGVRTFRVDNPHTKPLPFWEWMIADIRRAHPDAIFLAEAFTRPTMMYRLAKVGFSQSYTYFTWRDGKHELIDYITELTTTEPKEFYRPHFFVNTPDINPVFLQSSGRPGFQIRAVLAATLSGLFGVYSGFELCEAAPLPGREEYLDSEKYEIRPRDLATPGNIVADITLLNRLRRAHPALQTHLNTRFYLADNDNMIWYGKPSPDGGEMIMVMVNLDPHHAQETHFEVPLWEFGLSDTASIAVEDLGLGHRFDWHGKAQWIRITPDLPYRIWRLSAPGGPA